MTDTTPLPCPWCGLTTIYGGIDGCPSGECCNCGATSGNQPWNRRTPSSDEEPVAITVPDAPHRIYLCVGDIGEPGPLGAEAWANPDGVLWHTEPIDEYDIPYIRADLARPPAAQDAQDAARYRWLRGHIRFANDSDRELWFDASIVARDEPGILDRAIDAAMQENGNGN